MSRTNCAIGKDYAPASFKGVPFYAKEADIEGGRRGAEGEFPFGEHTAYADLGRKIRVYTLSAAFREDDHVLDSQALFAACESPGPGILVHPTRGAVMAACRKVKVKDDIEGSAGETTAELEFVEANQVGAGFGGLLFGLFSAGLSAASQGSFLRDYQPALVSQPWRADVIDTAQRLVGATATVAKIVLPPDAPGAEHREILRMEEVVQDDGLAVSGVNVNIAMVNGTRAIQRHVVPPDAEFNTFRRLANVASTTSLLPTGVAVKSEEAVISRHRVLAGMGMAEAALARKYAHVNEALMALDAVVTVLESEAQAAYAACDNELFLELRKYITDFSSMMHDLTYRLPGLVMVDFMGGVHPLVAAYVIYNDAKRHRDLEPRNVIDANGRFSSPVIGVAPV